MSIPKMRGSKRAEQVLFDAVWSALAEEGQCDAPGGCEYTRVRASFNSDLLVKAIAHFIRNHANQPANPVATGIGDR